jgi:(1->4)-alpha-D-glucan 1-alpha-D-glucosylmutase
LTPPTATYRVQLNKDFDFDQLREVLPYFAKLGISHVYASPIFQARRGSTHGYDIVEPNRISEELGGPDACDAVCRECAALGLGWIQDIVPNHVSYSTENGIIKDIMKRGERSEFCSFLDVDWNHPSRRLKGKIMAPFLEKSYRRCLREGKIRLVYNHSEGFKLQRHKVPSQARRLWQQHSRGQTRTSESCVRDPA